MSGGQAAGHFLDPKALEQQLQARRDSSSSRRTSLAEAIPGFPMLKHRQAPKAVSFLIIYDTKKQQI